MFNHKKIRIKKIYKKRISIFSWHKKITTKDITLLTRQLATMLNAGIPLVQALAIIGKAHANVKLFELTTTIKQHVEEGLTFSAALKYHPHLFNTLFCNLIAIGEQTSSLASVLEQLALYKEKSERLKSKIKKALLYPITIVAVTCAVSSIMLIFVIPQFENLFLSFGAKLPVFTSGVIAISHFVSRYWWLLVSLLGFIIYSFHFFYSKYPNFKFFITRYLLKLPIFGNLFMKAAVTKFSRTLATLCNAGIPIAEALEFVAPATSNCVFEKATKQIRHEITHGQSLSKAIQSVQCFPEMLVQMVSIGEEAGALENMLNKIADYFEEEVDNTVESLSTLIEPILMAILGVLLGGLIIAMYLPIFKMGSVL